MKYPKIEDFVYDLEGKSTSTQRSYSVALNGFFLHG